MRPEWVRIHAAEAKALRMLRKIFDSRRELEDADEYTRNIAISEALETVEELEEEVARIRNRGKK